MRQNSVNRNTTEFYGDGGGRVVVVVVEYDGGGVVVVVMVLPPPLYHHQSGDGSKKPLFEEYFDTSLEILTPVLQVVQVTNMRYANSVRCQNIFVFKVVHAMKRLILGVGGGAYQVSPQQNIRVHLN